MEEEEEEKEKEKEDKNIEISYSKTIQKSSNIDKLSITSNVKKYLKSKLVEDLTSSKSTK